MIPSPRTILSLLLLVAVVLLAAGCLGALTGKGIDRTKMTPSDIEFEEEYFRYIDSKEPFDEGIILAKDLAHMKPYAAGLMNATEVYGRRLNRENFTVSPALQKYQDTIIVKISLDRCSAENIIMAREMEIINDQEKKEKYISKATECKNQAVRANFELLQMSR